MKGNIINNKYSGFFLIELLITLGILGVFVLFISQWKSSIYQQKYDVKQYLNAINVANSLIDEISIYGYKSNKIKVDKFDITIEEIFSPGTKKREEKKDTKVFTMKRFKISWNTLKGKSKNLYFICGFIL